ncbi:hypothetical protein JOE62_000011 [Glutamicibacter nicotianae]|nr:hypothetical protein [Glutamicibacter nicotianae]
MAVSTYLFIWVGASLIATRTLEDRTVADLYPHDGARAGGSGEDAGPGDL